MTSARDLDINDLKGMPNVKYNFGVSANLKSASCEENNRRKTAREWAQKQANRSGLHKLWDDVTGGEDPPVLMPRSVVLPAPLPVLPMVV